MAATRYVTLRERYSDAARPDVPCSVHTRFILSQPSASCSPRQLKTYAELHRLAEHLRVWTVWGAADAEENAAALLVVREGRCHAFPAADALRDPAPADVILLGYADGAGGTPAGRLMYATTRRGARALRRWALPAEQTVDWLLATLGETHRLRVVRWPVSLTGRGTRPLASRNIKEILPDGGVLAFLVAVGGSAMLLWFACPHSVGSPDFVFRGRRGGDGWGVVLSCGVAGVSLSQTRFSVTASYRMKDPAVRPHPALTRAWIPVLPKEQSVGRGGVEKPEADGDPMLDASPLARRAPERRIHARPRDAPGDRVPVCGDRGGGVGRAVVPEEHRGVRCHAVRVPLVAAPQEGPMDPPLVVQERIACPHHDNRSRRRRWDGAHGPRV
jgi:hypothetical protein